MHCLILGWWYTIILDLGWCGVLLQLLPHQPADHGNVSSPKLVLLVRNDGIYNVGTAHGNIVGLDPHNGHALNSAVVCGGNVAVK